MRRIHGLVAMSLLSLPLWVHAHAAPGRIPRLREDTFMERHVEAPFSAPIPRSPSRSDEWISLGPDGGYISGMAMDGTNPDIMYASTYASPARIFRTADGGDSWVLRGVIDEWTYCLCIDPSVSNILYAGAYRSVHKSIDSGETWVEYSTPAQGCIYDLCVDPTNPDIVWAAGDDDVGDYSVLTVLKSIDGGETWDSEHLVTEASGSGYCISVSPNDHDTVYIGGFYINPYWAAALFRTTDGGLMWDEINSGIPEYAYPVHDLVIDPTRSGTLYAAAFDDVFKSTNGGDSWQSTSCGYYNYCIAISPSSPNTIYVGQYDEIRKTTDGGASWTTTGDGIVGCYMNRMLIEPDDANHVYVGNYVGLYETANGGSSWHSVQTDLRGKMINDVSLVESSPNQLFCAVGYDAIYKSIDAGANWTRLPGFGSCGWVAQVVIDQDEENRIYALAGG